MRNFVFIVFMGIFSLALPGCGSKNTDLGSENVYVGKEVSAYLRGAYMDEDDARETLEDAGFEVVGSYEPVKEGLTLLFTNEALKKEAAKPGRGHIGVLRLYIDKKLEKITITNPIYYGRAFMQDDFEYKVFAKILYELTEAFDDLVPSKDKLNYDALSEYHFMPTMPYYEDALELAHAKKSKRLLKRILKYKEGKKVVFVLKLSEKSTLVGYAFNKKTKRFVEKIGRENGTVLPWTILIENGKATALDAKYYIAISYPLLDMSGFASIANIPGMVEKELEKPFK